MTLANKKLTSIYFVNRTTVTMIEIPDTFIHHSKLNQNKIKYE